jgi:Arc/MetJ family transcription regulator
MVCVRTTITLDPDVAARINKEVAKGEQTFKEIVNSALRRGLGASTPKRRFVQRPWPGGGSEMLLTTDEIKQLLLDDDVERFREAGRR